MAARRCDEVMVGRILKIYFKLTKFTTFGKELKAIEGKVQEHIST